MQRLAVVHDTPVRAALLWMPGTGWMDHEVPSHRSAKAPLPTAVQALGEAHDTLLSCAPPVAGVAGIDHEVPSQASTSGAPLLSLPTAIQAVAEPQDTPARKPPNCLLGVGWMDQVVPFQRSASVRGLPPESSTEVPTAVQALAEVQDTAARALRGGAAGL